MLMSRPRSIYVVLCNQFFIFSLIFIVINHITSFVGLSPFKKIFICFNDSPSKIMKNAFYFILKALFVPRISKFLSRHFWHVEKRLD